MKSFKMECTNCGQHIESEIANLGCTVQCPTCHSDFVARPFGPKLKVPASNAPEALTEIPNRLSNANWDGLRTYLAARKWPFLGVVAVGLFALVIAARIAGIAGGKTTMTGQAFIVTNGRENVRLGALQVVLLEKEQVKKFLRQRQIEINAEIVSHKQKVEQARRDVIAAETNARTARRDLDITSTQFPTTAEYVRIETREQNLDTESASLRQEEQRLQAGLQSLGVAGNVEKDENQAALIVQGQYFVRGAAVGLFDTLTDVQNRLLDIGRVTEELHLQLSELHEQIKEEARLRSDRAQSAVADAQTKVKDLEYLLRQFPAPEDYLRDISSTVAISERAVTDADGRFSITYTHRKEWTICASAERMVGKDTEKYYWVVDAPKAVGSSQILLNNNNLAEVDPDGYLAANPN